MKGLFPVELRGRSIRIDVSESVVALFDEHDAVLNWCLTDDEWDQIVAAATQLQMDHRSWYYAKRSLFAVELREQSVHVSASYDDVTILSDDGEVLEWRLSDEEWWQILSEAQSRDIETDFWGYDRPDPDDTP